MDISYIGKIFIIAGVILICIGIILLATIKMPFIGKLPGDILVKKGDFVFYFPVSTMLIISIVLTLVLNFIFKK